MPQKTPLDWSSTGKVVFFCGSYPNHALDVPTGDDAATKLRDIIDYFNDKNSGKNKAYEIKLTTFV